MRTFPWEEIMNRRILTTTVLLSSAVVFATTFPKVGQAQSNPLIGTWKLNLAKSTYSPGPPPRSQTITTQAEEQGLRFTVDTIDPQGNSTKAVLAGIDDGKSYPVTGNADYEAASFKQVNDSTAWIIRTKAGKVVQTLVSVVSADGKTWTLTTAGVTQAASSSTTSSLGRSNRSFDSYSRQRQV
jgi:hypothetical protein